MSNRECEKMYSKAGIDEKILDNFFCAGTSEGGSDTCDVSLINTYDFI